VIQLLASAIVSGVLLTCAYPKISWWLLSAVALVPVLTIMLKKRDTLSWRQVYLGTYLFSAVWHLAAIWWIGYVTVTGMIVLSLFISLFCAGMLTLGWWLVRRNYPALLVFPAVWMVFECIVTYIMTGFPWLLLGYTWRPWLTIIQVSDIAGVYAVSFCVISANTAVAESIIEYTGGTGWRKNIRPLTWAAGIIAVCCLYGTIRIRMLQHAEPQKTVSVACIQANIPSLVKHDHSKNEDTLRKYGSLSEAAVQSNIHLVIWPETAIPGYYYQGLVSFKMVTNILRNIDTPLMTGMPRYEVDPGTRKRRFYNSAVIFNPSGIAFSTYDKIHLVMFGEYVPFEQFLPFLKLVTPISGSFTSGRVPQLLVLTSNGITCRFGPLICFEDVFGYLSRRMAREGADILVNLTNDGWFRSSPGPYQHAELSAFRAVETRRPLIRATNSGITTVIDQLGNTTAELRKGNKLTEIHGILYADVPVENGGITLYARFGDWFLGLWILVTAGMVVIGIRKK
jgi:apolipoprotein N-acyltransferase